MNRQMRLIVEVKQGHDIGSVIRLGAGEPVERSTYEMTHTVWLPANVTLEDVHHAITKVVEKLRDGAA